MSPQLEPSRDSQGTSSSPILDKKVLSTKKISTDRNIDFIFLDEQGFTFGQNIKTLGWEYFYFLNKPTYLDLVKKIYMHLSLGDKEIVSIVKNTLIRVNLETLHEELQILLVEHSDITPSRRESLTVIMNNENIDTKKDYFIRDFSFQMRLLHHIVNRIFFLKVDRFDFVTQRNMYIMYHILMKKSINLSKMIMSHMVDQMNRKSGSLSYGMLLTVLFENASIDLTNEVSQNLLHIDTFA